MSYWVGRLWLWLTRAHAMRDTFEADCDSHRSCLPRKALLDSPLPSSEV